MKISIAKTEKLMKSCVSKQKTVQHSFCKLRGLVEWLKIAGWDFQESIRPRATIAKNEKLKITKK